MCALRHQAPACVSGVGRRADGGHASGERGRRASCMFPALFRGDLATNRPAGSVVGGGAGPGLTQRRQTGPSWGWGDPHDRWSLSGVRVPWRTL
jgi:hypothetical protein